MQGYKKKRDNGTNTFKGISVLEFKSMPEKSLSLYEIEQSSNALKTVLIKIRKSRKTLFWKFVLEKRPRLLDVARQHLRVSEHKITIDV